MNKKVTLGLTLSLIAIASAVTFILTSFFSLESFNKKVVDVNEKAAKYEKLESLDTFVRQNYYSDINEENLNYGILKGYVNGLSDKYSKYLTADEYQEELADESGKAVGLGITVEKDESGYIAITDILDNSPLNGSDVKVGAIIVAIDSKDVLTEGFEESVDSMRGIEGTDITITVRRDGKDSNYTFKRASMEVISVTGDMLDNYIGYIKISAFKKNTPEQFNTQLEKLVANGAKAIIFDVRDNDGGLVSSVEDCLDPLLPEGVVAVAEYDANKTETLVYSDATELNLPMTVIVNGKTASYAELFAAALRDFGKAKLVGEQTFGNGVLQNTTEFDDGSAVVLTVAKYKTVNSECYDGIGLTPDYIAEVSKENPKADAQLNKAIEAIKEQMKN